MREIALEIAGLGFILYSPPAVAHIAEGADYLSEQFRKAEDVARHVMAGQLTAFCTGSPGMFRLRFRNGLAERAAVEAADFKLRLGLQVRDGVVCIRDLYDLMDWSAACPENQRVPVCDGWYRLTVLSSPAENVHYGDGQVIDIYLESVSSIPSLRWEGVPLLCEAAPLPPPGSCRQLSAPRESKKAPARPLPTRGRNGGGRKANLRVDSGWRRPLLHAPGVARDDTHRRPAHVRYHRPRQAGRTETGAWVEGEFPAGKWERSAGRCGSLVFVDTLTLHQGSEAFHIPRALLT